MKRPERINPARWRLLLRSFPVWALVAAVGVFCLLRMTANEAAQKAYDEGDFHSSRVTFDRLRILNVAQRWVADYNAGTAHAQEKRWDAAQTRLATALKRAPGEWDCRVRLNLVFVIEAAADDLETAANHAKAAEEYARARTLLDQGDCGDPDSPSPSSPDPSSPDPSSGDPSSPDPSSPDPSSGQSSPGESNSGESSGQPSSGESGQSSGQSSSGQDKPDPEQEAQQAGQARERLEIKERQSRGGASDNPTPQTQPTGSESQPTERSADPSDQSAQAQQRASEAASRQQRARDYENNRTSTPAAMVSRPW